MTQNGSIEKDKKTFANGRLLLVGTLFEVLLDIPRRFGPSDGLIVGHMRLNEALIGSLKPFDAP